MSNPATGGIGCLKRRPYRLASNSRSVSSIIALGAFRAAKRTDDPLQKAGMRVIGWAVLFIVFTFIFIAADSVVVLIMGTTGSYSAVGYGVAISAGISVALLAVGFLQPEFFRKRMTSTRTKHIIDT